MVFKKKGVVNEIVYNQTIYNEGKSRICVSLIHLKHIIAEVNSSNETSNYMRIIPFYVNANLAKQIEYDEYMFYMECRDSYNRADLEKHWEECMDNIYDIPHGIKRYQDMDEQEQYKAQMQYPLSTFEDTAKYQRSLNNYILYLEDTLPTLLKDAIIRMSLSEEDIAFGYFCFEINSD